jgi:acyl-CoA synthetase (AMP-forming)/AMP-acid ligase II
MSPITRRPRVIIVGGRNVFPEDIERACGSLDGVRAGNVIAFGVEGYKGKETVIVVAEVRLADLEPGAESLETVRSAIGEYRTVIFRSARPDSKNGTYFWCAPDLGYLPLKVERRDGKEVQWSMAVKRADIEARP